jgi:hypothetical protein
MKPSDLQVARFSGLNTVEDPLNMGLSWLTQADNVNITSADKIVRRDGYDLDIAGEILGAYATIDHQRLFFIDGTSLKSYDHGALVVDRGVGAQDLAGDVQVVAIAAHDLVGARDVDVVGLREPAQAHVQRVLNRVEPAEACDLEIGGFHGRESSPRPWCPAIAAGGNLRWQSLASLESLAAVHGLVHPKARLLVVLDRIAPAGRLGIMLTQIALGYNVQAWHQKLPSTSVRSCSRASHASSIALDFLPNSASKSARNICAALGL